MLARIYIIFANDIFSWTIFTMIISTIAFFLLYYVVDLIIEVYSHYFRHSLDR